MGNAALQVMRGARPGDVGGSRCGGEQGVEVAVSSRGGGKVWNW